MNQPIGGAHQDEDGALDRLDVLGGQVKVHFGVLPAVHRIGAGGRLRDGGAQKAHGRRSAQDGGVHLGPADQVQDQVAAQADAVDADAGGIHVGKCAQVVRHRETVVHVGDLVGGEGQAHSPFPGQGAVVGHHDHVTFLKEALPDRAAVRAPRPARQLFHAPSAGSAMEVN